VTALYAVWLLCPSQRRAARSGRSGRSGNEERLLCIHRVEDRVSVQDPSANNIPSGRLCRRILADAVPNTGPHLRPPFTTTTTEPPSPLLNTNHDQGMDGPLLTVCTYLTTQILDLVHEEERGRSDQTQAKDERRPDQSTEGYVSTIAPTLNPLLLVTRALIAVATHRPD
jgi:hypothetical protein